MTATDTAAVTTLKRLINEGAFASTVENLKEEFRRNKNSLYTATLAREGRDVAERKLAMWIEGFHRNTYAACLEPIAHGIVAQTTADMGNLVDITDCAAHVATPINAEFGTRHKFITFSSQTPLDSHSRPERNAVWAPYGSLGLRAVILEAGHGRKGPIAEVTLALSGWQMGYNSPQPRDLALITFDTTGYSRGVRYTLTSDGTKNCIDFLKRLLGIPPLKRTSVDVFSRIGNVGDILGFLDAQHYIPAHLPSLGNYFVALSGEPRIMRAQR